MTIPGQARVLRASQIAAYRDTFAMFDGAAEDAAGIIIGAAEPDGSWPRMPMRRDRVRQRVGELVLRLFADETGRAFGFDGVTAVAPFPALLNRQLAAVQYGAIRNQNLWLRRNVSPDLFTWMSRSRPRAVPISEQTQGFDALFVDTARLDYDAAHLFVDDGGYRLSDRIWRAGQRTRAKVDRLLTSSIANGDGARRTAQSLFSSLKPSRQGIVTRRPYGTLASYDAMRLARTEITASFGRATIASAQANPWVAEMRWELSPTHPRADECDEFEGLHPLDGVPAYPAHPMCQCLLIPETLPRAQVEGAIRSRLDDARGMVEAYINPADLAGFTEQLLGPALRNLLPQLLA